MKKIFVFLLLVVMMLTMVLSSCAPTDENPEEQPNEPISAQDLMDSVMAEMNALTSAKFFSENTVSAFYNDIPIKVVSRSDMRASLLGEDDVYYYGMTEVTTTTTNSETKNKTIEAFFDGNYYYGYEADEESCHFKSELTTAEFMYYIENLASNENFFEDSGQISYVENPDGGYIINLSEYDSHSILTMNSRLGFPLEENGGKVTAFNTKIVVNSDLLITSIVFDYVFSDSTFSGKHTVAITEHNKLERDKSLINTEEYIVEAGYALAIPLAKKYINDKTYSTDDSFKFTMKQTVSANGQETTTEEEDTVVYGVYGEDKFFFNIDSKVNSETHKITYKEGVYKQDGEKVNSKIDNDLLARQFIGGLIDPFTFNQTEVVSMKCVEEDGVKTYTLEIGGGHIFYYIESLYANMDAHFTNITVILTFKVNDDYELISIGYDIKAKVIIAWRTDAKISITTCADFSD